MVTPALLTDIEHLRSKWGWLLAFGIALIVLGTVALTFIPAATLGSVVVLGWLMILSGFVEAVEAVRVRRWQGVFLHIIGGLLGVLVGLMIVANPVAGALVWTLLFAAFLSVVGLFRIIVAIHLKYRTWGWAVFDGAITLALGVMLIAKWPSSAIWFLGFTLGISLILRGWSTVMFAFAVRSFAQVIPMRRAA
jgi:uncharacterized membrane protein HdeD (DUF308 family)